MFLWLIVEISLVMITLLLLKILFSVLQLALAEVLMAIYFRGCSSLLNKWSKLPYKFALPLSALLNIIPVASFFWIVGAGLEQQTAQLSKTLLKP